MRVWPEEEVRDVLRAEDALRALRAASDNIELAEFFIDKAQQANRGGGDLRLRWCISIAANGLWSAVDIFNKKMAVDKGDRLKQGSLVRKIRHGQVHDSYPYGVGEKLDLKTSTPITSSFLWVGDFGDPGDPKEIPVEEALSRLTEVATTVKEHIIARTGKWYIGFS